MPPFLLPDVIEHLEQFTGTADDQLVFSGPKGAQLRRSNFTRQWRKTLRSVRDFARKEWPLRGSAADVS
jgi:hypothetical protein